MGNIDLNPVTEAEFERLFIDFKSSAWRLELLPSYDVVEEASDLDAYKNGTFVAADNSEWCSEISAARKKGKAFNRIRKIDGEPTMYIKYEIDSTFRDTVPAGEEIRFIDQVEECGLEAVTDFWLFDEQVVILMEYDSDGKFVKASRVPDTRTQDYVRAWKKIWNLAKPITELSYWNDPQ